MAEFIPNLEVVDAGRYVRLRDALDKSHKAFFPPHVTRNFRKGCAIKARKRIDKYVGRATPKTLVLYWRQALIEAAREGAFVVSYADLKLPK